MRVQTAILVATFLAGCGLAGCGGRTKTKPAPPTDAGTDAEPDGGPTQITESDKLDVLFVIDNSRTASVAHAALVETMPYLIDRLVEPRCVNGLGQIVDPAPAGQPCAVGQREFAPLTDIHIGVVSTSVGGHGADSCSPLHPNFHAQQNDQGELISRSAGGQVPTYRGLGFLAWDPNQQASPPGDSDRPSYEAKLSEILLGVGGQGCGFEAPLEAFYRFLIEPVPYGEIVRRGDTATLVGENSLILEQRAAFLRPDSAVLIVLISDEDDCSMRDGGQYFFVAESQNGTYHLPRPRAECAVDPDDACCASCGQSPPDGCPSDPGCGVGGLTEEEDPINLRCFDQKRRFGIDFLYPLSRYVEGVSQPRVADQLGDVQDNPLFDGPRSPEMVVVAAIAGVPWQDIALSAHGVGSGFLPPHQIPWSRVLADGDAPPEDPLMIPSRAPRTGTNPVTGDDLAASDAASPEANPINGHEHDLPTELQYACTYRLQTPINCMDDECECSGAVASDHNPICQADDGSYDQFQRHGRATPATRQLALVRELERQSAVASICTAPITNPADEGFGYKPAVDAILRTLRRSLVKEGP